MIKAFFCGHKKDERKITSKSGLTEIKSIKSFDRLIAEIVQLVASIQKHVEHAFRFERENGSLHRLYNVIRKTLIYDLDIETFADIYAQTVTYGLFSIKTFQTGEFSVKNIATLLSYINPPLKGLFGDFITTKKTDNNNLDFEELSILGFVKKLEEININAILKDFAELSKEKDLVTHLYELFLKKYDSTQKFERGVFYTPNSIVSFIVRSVDKILRTKLGYPDGLADEVAVLDPATGTGTFLKAIIKTIKETFDNKNKELDQEQLNKKWNVYVSKNLLPRLYGFEVMLTPFTVAQLKLGFKLKETGYNFQEHERLQIYLVNCLNRIKEDNKAIFGQIDPGYVHWIFEETHKADLIKKDVPIEVIIGNPPYSGRSANKNRWIYSLLRGKGDPPDSNYFEVDEKPLKEKNPKWLNDDYVKFIRFGQWRIDKTGHGVLAFITNHSYIDSPTFRGMRQQLMKSFTDIYILDLHGNTKKREVCSDGSKDQNIFDIKQGVAICFFIKNPEKRGPTKIYHADLWGLREEKYNFLAKNDIDSIQWTKINPVNPFYFFFPIDLELQHEFEKEMRITEIMPVNTVGLVTARDQLTIKNTPEEVWEVVQDFSSLSAEQARVKYNLGKDTIEWKVKLAQKDLIDSGLKTDSIVPILYRPFDIKYTYYTGKSKGFICRPRPDFMNHMIKDNLALCVGRAGQVVGIDKLWNLVFCSKYVIDLNIFYRGGSSNFPLYIYQNGYSDQERIPNFSKEFLERLQSVLERIPSPKDTFFYIYAILHSPTYRRRYKEFLRVDYPRIPLTSKSRLFESLSKLGCELVLLHTMESPKQQNTVIYLKGEGNNVVGAIRKASFMNEKLRINNNQFFEKINEKVYNYYTGGYQLVKKWFKDRKGNELTEQEVINLNKMIIAISRSLEIMDEIDKIIEELGGGWPLI